MEEDLEHRVARFLKVELKRAGLTYEELAEKLATMGFKETKPSIANKLSRGTFSAAFFVAVAQALALPAIKMEDI